MKLVLVSGLLFLAFIARAETDPFDFDLSDQLEQKQSPWQTTGGIEYKQAHAIKQKSRFLNQAIRLDLETQYKNDALTYLVQAYIEHDSSRDAYRDRIFSELNLAYIAWQNERRYISLGKQRIAWGLADGRSAADVLNAVDFRNPLANARTASRRPSWMLYWQEKLPIGDLELAWLPRGKDEKLPEPNSPWENRLLANLRAQGAQRDADTKPAYGVRWMQYGAGFDLGLTLFQGHEDLPQVLGLINGKPKLEAQKLRLVTLGVAKGLTSSTLRAELSYAKDRYYNDGPGLILRRDDFASIIAGWDTTFFSSFYVNFQVYWQDHGDLDEVYGATYALSEKFFDDALEIGLRGALEKRQALSAELYADYQLDDEWRLKLRAMTFNNNAFEGRDFIEVSVRYSF